MTNLVANAINYTPAGRIRVRTFLENDRVCLPVEDTGLGIDPEDIPYDSEGKRVHRLLIRGLDFCLSLRFFLAFWRFILF